ncbi:MAG: O-succinylbenzoic acid--CoA ligase [Proteobacteria bacterium]|nr:MAG: O-succinylbenzoic acid--CoA ligase [Pseudomonadota bacterium]
MDWSHLTIPAMRQEVWFGDRVTPAFVERPKSIWAMVAEAAARHGDGEAVVCGERRMTWGEVAEMSARVAAGMEALGITAGDRIALLLGNRIEFMLAWFAAAHLGAVAVPLSVRHHRHETAYILNHCAARLVIHEAALAASVPDAREAPTVAFRIGIGGGDAASSFEMLIAASPRTAPTRVAEDDTAMILYTSGTTGQPKGAMLAHCNVIHSAMVYEACFELTAAARSLAAVPFAHVTGSVANIAAAARAACALIVAPEFKAAEFLALAARERATHTIMVPAMYNLCLMQADFDRYDLSAWRVGGYGGAPMPISTIERLAARLPNLKLINGYGATETTSPSTIIPPQYTASHSDSVGLPCPGTTIVVMDDEGREVPRGEVGELWIHSGSVIRGYWNNPDATAENFVAGYWRSGDLGTIDADGFVRVLDRKKDMINRGGMKIFSAEVESVLASHPAVLESAVIAEPCPILGERVRAVVVASDPQVEAHDLRAWCAARLADYKVPETVTFSETPLPRNANGKVMKRQLRDERLELPA